MSIDTVVNWQSSPYPTELADLIKKFVHRPGWTFELNTLDRGQGSEGLTLTIKVRTVNSYNHDEVRVVLHYFPVPPAAYQRRDWQRWLLEQCRLVDTHETCEFFTIDGVKPYAPNHGPGRDPYTVVEVGTAEDAATSWRGEVKRDDRA